MFEPLRKDMFLDRPWLGEWKKSSFPAVGNTMSKGMETGNGKLYVQ